MGLTVTGRWHLPSPHPTLLLRVCSPCGPCACMQTPETFPWELLGEAMPCCMSIPQVHVPLAKSVLGIPAPAPAPAPSILTVVLLICSSQHPIGCLRHSGNHLMSQFLYSTGPVSHVFRHRVYILWSECLLAWEEWVCPKIPRPCGTNHAVHTGFAQVLPWLWLGPCYAGFFMIRPQSRALTFSTAFKIAAGLQDGAACLSST